MNNPVPRKTEYKIQYSVTTLRQEQTLTASFIQFQSLLVISIIRVPIRYFFITFSA